MEDSDITPVTTAKTLWTETVLEILYLALKYDKPDKDITKLLSQIRTKGCKPAYIIRKVSEKLDDGAATRVRDLLHN